MKGSWLAASLVVCAGTVAGAATPAAAPKLLLGGDGFSANGKHATFGTTTRALAITLASTALGKPLKIGSHGECGNGDTIDYAAFRGDFELAFVKGKLTGWTADGPDPKTTRNIGTGATVAALRKAYPDVDLDPGDEKNGGLGPSFQREGGPNGWLDGTKPGSKVAGLFAGETCLSGV